MILTLILLSQLYYGQFVQATITSKRDPHQVFLFRQVNACPSTGKLGMGACPNFVVNHVWSLCLGGPDVPENMEWQSKIESYITDIMERHQCEIKKKLGG